MATTRTQEEIQTELDAERDQLASAVEQLRGELNRAANLGGKLQSNLPVFAAGAAAFGFVFAGGVGATFRYFARRGRERG
jgi:hypothetical protein